MKNIVKTAIRELAEFILRSGDLGGDAADNERALEGSKIHRMLQKEGGEHYDAEVFLSHDFELENTIFSLEGRADGIICDEGTYTIDEIKTMSYIPEDMSTAFPAHKAQLNCYALIYAIQNGLPVINTRLTYYNIYTHEIRRHVEEKTCDELNEYVLDLLKRYEIWTEMQNDHILLRNESINQLSFPFPSYRKGQRQMAVAVYKTLKSNSTLFCCAPTGIGKTVSAVFPALKYLSESNSDKIFYLTAKTTNAEEVIKTATLLNCAGLKTISLNAKDKMCLMPETDCNPEKCEYARNFFSKVNDIVFDAIANNDIFTKEIITKIAIDNRVCPFELSLELSLFCDIIIGDYNYVFDPAVYLKRFFYEKPHGKYVFLVDEAHNLPDRARMMYSSVLYKKPFMELKRSFKDRDKKISKAANRVNSQFIRISKENESRTYKLETDIEFAEEVEKFTDTVDEWLQKAKENGYSSQTYIRDGVFDSLLELFFLSNSFVRIYKMYDEHYVTLYHKDNSDTSIKLFCRDPSFFIKEALKRSISSVFFSATLSPMDFYINLNGGVEDAPSLNLQSPFNPDNLKVLIADYIGTSYKERDFSLETVSDMINTIISQKCGNYMVFFPSYKYMTDVYNIYKDKYGDYNTIVQSSHMDDSQKREFLSRFQENTQSSLLAFTVLGSIFSEGIDLKGDLLIGAIIVGVGLPQVNTEQEIIRDYYGKTSGFDYAYRFPGINKVLQAGGRVIRDENDKGIIVLIDKRYSDDRYLSLIPEIWKLRGTYVRNMLQVKNELNTFWRN